MKEKQKIQAGILILSAILFASCSADPKRQQLKYLASGEKYMQTGKVEEAVIQFRNAVQIDRRFASAHYQLARAYRALKNSEAAYKELLEAVTLDPADVNVQLDLAELLVLRRQYENAAAAAQKALHAEPNNARAHAVLGEKYAATRDIPKAIQELQRAIDSDPRRVEYYTALAAIHLANRESAAAEAVNRRAVEANPKSFQAHLSLGQFYLSEGKMAEAEREMRAASQLDPRASAPRLMLATICMLTARPTDAEKIYAELKKIAPDDPDAFQALGRFYLSTGQKEKAAAEFRSLVAMKPQETSVKMSLVESLIDLNRIPDADSVCREILHGNPNDALALLASGRILLAQGKYQEAAATLEKTVKSAPKSADGYYFLGVAQQKLGFHDLAKTNYARAVELQPRMTDAAVALAGLNVRGGHNDEALRLSEGAITAAPDSASAYVVSARAVLAKGDLRKGEALLQDALIRDPASLPALASFLKLCVSQGRTAEAMRRISELVQRDSNNASLHFLMAVGYFSLKDLQNSETSLRRAIALDPRTTDAYTLLANVDFASGAPEEAKKHLRAAIDLHPNNVANYVALATQYEREGNWVEAKRLFETAHQLDGNAPLIAAELAYLYLDHGGDVNVAVSLAQTAKRNIPDSAVGSDALGWSYYKLGSTQLAIAQLEESVQRYPGNAMYQYHLGMAYLAARRFGPAARSLQTAVRQDPNSAYASSSKAELQKMSGLQ